MIEALDDFLLTPADFSRKYSFSIFKCIINDAVWI